MLRCVTGVALAAALAVGACTNSERPVGLSILYIYSDYRNRDDIKEEVFVSGVDGKRKTGLGITLDPLERVWFAASPDGRQVARWDGRTLAIAWAGDLPSFRTIVQVRTGEHIERVVWSSDGSALVYVIGKGGGDTGTIGGVEGTRIHSISADGTGGRLIRAFPGPEAIAIVGFDSRGERLYWIHTAHGFGPDRNLTVVDAKTGAIEAVFEEVSTEGALVISPDFTKVYYVAGPDGDRVVELSLRDRTRRTLYRAPESPREPERCGSAVVRLIASPRGDALILGEALEPAGRVRTLRISLPERRVRTLVDDAGKHRHTLPAAWSPDGRYVWLEDEYAPCARPQIKAASSYIMDLETGRLTLLFRGTPGVADWVKLAGWLVER